MHITGDLSLADFGTLISHEGYPKLADYLHAAHPGDEVHRGRGEVLRGRVRGRADGRHRRPDVRSLVQHAGRVRARARWPLSTAGGQECPELSPRRSRPFCGRYFINSADALNYGTRDAFPSWIYPEDGNRFFPGTDASALAGHTGGDVWVADAAIEMMQRRALVGDVRDLGAIDKAAHMWGAQADAASFTGDCNDPDPAIRGANQTHVRCAAEIADVQLGRAPGRRRRARRERRRGDLGGAHRRPWGHVRRRRILREDGARGHQQQQLVLRARTVCGTRASSPDPASPCRNTPLYHEQHLQPAVAGSAAVDRHGQRRVLLPIDGGRDVADRSLRREDEGGRGGDAEAAGGDRRRTGATATGSGSSGRTR